MHANNQQSVKDYLSELNEKQREVLCRRFGLAGHKIQTLDEISHEVGLTGERVRQLQITALKALRDILIKHGLIIKD